MTGPSSTRTQLGPSWLAVNLLTTSDMNRQSFRSTAVFVSRYLIFFSLPFVCAKSAFSISDCVRESMKFADCVDSAILANQETASREALTEQVVKACTAEKREYEACGQFEKVSFSADFIKVRVELFTQDSAKAFAGTPAGPDPATN